MALAAFEIELIGGAALQEIPELRPWVAQLIAYDEVNGFIRDFVRYDKRDYSRANRARTRGIYLCYLLHSGIYEVFSRSSWQRTNRYYIMVDCDNIRKIDRQEAIDCLTSDC